jgi:hypothetical protein
MVRKHQTRNRESPGSMLSHRPGMTMVKNERARREGMTAGFFGAQPARRPFWT